MPDFNLTGPDGGSYTVTAPDENSAVQAFQSMHGGGATPPQGNADNWGPTTEIMNAATMGNLPSIEGWIGSKAPALGIPPTAQLQADRDAYAQAHPYVSGAANIAGKALPYLAAPEGFLANAGVSSLIGAGQGAAGAVHDGTDPTTGAVVGGTLGGAGSGVGSALGWGVSPVAKGVASAFGKTGAPEFADANALTAARQAAYKPVDNSDLVAPMDKTQALADSIRKASWGYDQSPISGIIRAVDDMNTPEGGLNKVTPIATLDALRKIANKSNSDSAPALGGVINDFIKDPANFVGNDSHSDVVSSLMEGRKLSSQEAKLEAFSEPMDKATDMGARYGTSANRQGTVATNLKYGDEPWSADEIAGLNKIQHPGMLAEMLRHYGKLDPTGSNPAAWIEGGITPLVAMEGGIPAIATQAAILAGAAGARRASDFISKNAINDETGTILNRGVNPYGPNMAQKALPYINPVAKALTRSGASSAYPDTQ